MKIKYVLGTLIAASLILGSGSTALVAAQAPSGSHLRLLSSDGQAIVLELTVDDFQIETLEHAGQTYHRFLIPDMAQTTTPGEPQVPMRGTLLGLSSTENVSVQVLEASYETLSGYRLYPAPRLEVPADNLDDLLAEGVQPIFAPNQAVYTADTFYPGEPVKIGTTGYIRDQAVAQVQFYPVQYNPVTGEVRLYRRILARVTWDMPISAATTEVRGASPAFENLFRSTLLNYDALERPPVIDQAPAIEPADIVATSITPTLKMGVTEDGLYQLNPSDLTGAGFELSGVALSTIKIKNRGAEIPIYVHDNNSNDAFDGNDYLLFYGTAITDIYTTRNVYWLEAGGDLGQRMDTQDGTPSGATVPTHFPATLHAEEDTDYWQSIPSGEGQDHWFWGSRLSAPESRDYSLTLNNIISPTTSTATVHVRLRGYTAPNHCTKIYLNGHEIDDRTWDGQIIYDHQVTVPHSYLNEGSNTVRVEAVDIGLNQFYVNWIEIDYWDTYVAENDELLFGAPWADTFQFEVTGFSSSDVDVFDVTDPANVVLITPTVPLADGIQFEDAAQPETRYLALTSAQRKSPDSIELDQPSSWKSSSNGADYILITHEDFYTSTLTLANHRDSDLRVVTVKIGDIYDEFNDGIFNPQAIRDFLSYAYKEWVDPKPAYVLLVGDAYLNYLSTSMVNYVPTQIIEIDSYGQTFSDNWFVLVSGPDILPDMFIGRLAAQTASQAEDMVAKIIYYDQNPPDDSWNKKVLLVADDGQANDGYTEAFEITSDHLADRLPHYYMDHKVYVRYYPPGDPTTDITNYINGGSILVSYAGHGSVETWGAWSNGVIFNRWPHVVSLNNTHKLPVVTLADCLNGYFVGSATSIAEEFQRLPDRGAVAVWASTALGLPSAHRELMEAFYEAIFQDNKYALGEATTAAKFQSNSEDLIETFVLFGDPATPLGIPTNYPYVESTTPADGATGVPLDQDIQIVFSKPMSPTTVVISGPGTAGLVLTPTWNPEKTVLNYTHTGFGYNETRTFTISGQDNLENPLGPGPVPSTWSFTTLTAPDKVAISGPTTGAVQVGHTFNAAVHPITATQPITYTWQATAQSPEMHPGGGLNDTINFTWNVTGTQAVTVTAMNALGTVTNTHVITITEASQSSVFLPIVIKND